MVLASSALGAFAAGVAIPDDTFSCGGTSTCVAALALALHGARQADASSAGRLAAATLVFTTVLGVFRGSELVSHVAGCTFYTLLYCIATQDRHVIAVVVYMAAVTALVAAFCIHASAPALRFLAPQV
jgi:hypothetical protein